MVTVQSLIDNVALHDRHSISDGEQDSTMEEESTSTRHSRSKRGRNSQNSNSNIAQTGLVLLQLFGHPSSPIQVCKVMVTNPHIPVLHPPGGGGVEEAVAKNRATGTLHNLHRRNNTQSRRCMYTVQT